MRLKSFVIFFAIVAYLTSCVEEKRVEYYSSGTKKIEAEINKKDELDGVFKSFYEGGQLAYEGEYRQGHRIGKHIQYYEDGKIMDELKYELRNGGEVLIEKKKYAPDGLIYLHAVNVERNFDIDVLDKEIALGDTVTVSVKLKNNTYEQSIVIIAEFDKNLNVVDSTQSIQNFVGGDDHRVLVKVVPSQIGSNKFTGLFRDFTIDLIPGSDSLGYRIAEDSYFEFTLKAGNKKLPHSSS